jgi:AmiR/NasT family two-component response regulator
MSSDGRSTTAIDAATESVRVLIAEDDAELRGVLREKLTASGHVIVGEASTMTEALERSRELVPDILLLDSHLGPSQLMEAAKTLATDQPGIARELRSAREEVAEVRKQLENRKAIERAKGILMRRTGLSEQEAYRILQRTSQDRSVPMVDVAREVLDSEPGASRQ